LNLSFGRFGDPCDLEIDQTTHVVMLHCDRVGTPEESGITVNFYLPGIWKSGPLTAEHVARLIRDNPGASTHLEGAFEAPDVVTGRPAYFLAMSAVYPDTDQGQVFIMKVATVEDAVYSVSYTTMFPGQQAEALTAKIRAWLAEHLTEYSPEIGGLTPDPSWVAHLRTELHEHRARLAQPSASGGRTDMIGQ
jgi:hypothetical protein